MTLKCTAVESFYMVGKVLAWQVVLIKWDSTSHRIENGVGNVPIESSLVGAALKTVNGGNDSLEVMLPILNVIQQVDGSILILLNECIERDDIAMVLLDVGNHVPGLFASAF